MSGCFSNSKYDHEWRMAIRISALFLLIGGLWILFSDRMVVILADDPQEYARFQLWKGWFFVVAVSFILLFLIKGYLLRNRRLSDSLEQSEVRFGQIIEKSGSGICVTDENGIFEYVNSAYCRIYGYSSDELIGRSITLLLDEGKQQAALNIHRKLFINSDEGKGLWEVLDKGGHKKYVVIDILPVIWINGEQRLVTFVYDVTRQVRAEEELKRSEKKYRTMMAALDVPLYITDNNCRVLFANQAYCDRYGDAGDETYCYRAVKGKHERCYWCKETHLLRPGEKYIREFHNEVDGRIYQAVMVPVEFEPGELQKMVVLRDLTDIIKARERAEESDRLKTAFLANMSHEVRTPLNAILGFSSIFNDKTLPSEERGRFIDLIHQSGIQLLNIIDDIVDVARIEQGNLRISMMPVELQPLLREVMDIMKLDLADGRKPDIELSMQNHLPAGFHFLTDPLRLKQVLMNLLNNAIKFTKKGEVVLEVFSNEKQVVFNVEDSGMGMPPDKIEVIFERFRQVDESSTRGAGGNGLGLFISKNLVEKMGGKISVRSNPGNGSVFTLVMNNINN